MKKIKTTTLVILLAALAFFLLSNNVFADCATNSNDCLPETFCDKAGVLKSFQIIGICLQILKILIPIILIVFGSVELGKAIISNDEKAIKLATSSLVKKAIAGVVVFFIPTILAFVINLVGNSNKLNDFKKCTDCLKNNNSCQANTMFNTK